jgi:hypothetical protein
MELTVEELSLIFNSLNTIGNTKQLQLASRLKKIML